MDELTITIGQNWQGPNLVFWLLTRKSFSKIRRTDYDRKPEHTV